MDLIRNCQPRVVLALEQERIREERIEWGSAMYVVDIFRRELDTQGCG